MLHKIHQAKEMLQQKKKKKNSDQQETAKFTENGQSMGKQKDFLLL